MKQLRLRSPSFKQHEHNLDVFFRCFLRILPWDSSPGTTTIWDNLFGTFVEAFS